MKMLSLFRNIVLQIPKSTSKTTTSAFHLLSPANPSCVSFLLPKLHNKVQESGLKVLGRVKRRCKDCYMVMREGRLFVECKTFGRHKQVTIAKKPKNSWMLSHATQSKVRPW